MGKIFMPERTPDERRRILEDTADRVEETVYQKQLTQEDLDINREQVADNSIELESLDEERKETAKRFKEQIDPLKATNKQLLREIRTRQKEVQGKIFYMANHESGMMELYDAEGEMISSRRLRPDERQATILTPLRRVAGE